MKPVVYLACILAVMGLAFWAYRENYRTQSALSEMSNLQLEIAGLREDLGVLRAEWSYLNRPERLRELVELNFDKLQLVPIESDQFIDLKNIDYPSQIPEPAPSDEPSENKEAQP